MLLSSMVMAAAAGMAQAAPMKFDFGTTRAAPGTIAVDPACDFTEQVGHGFEIGKRPTAIDRGGEPWRGTFR